jgi:hypothetical protein
LAGQLEIYRGEQRWSPPVALEPDQDPLVVVGRPAQVRNRQRYCSPKD